MAEPRTVSGASLGPQVFLTPPDAVAPTEEFFAPVPVQMGRGWIKPSSGGMWTSSPTVEHHSGWGEWCADEQFGVRERRLWILTPEPDAELAEIHCYADLDRLHRLYGRSEGGSTFRDSWLDYSLIAERYAGVHLTDDGQWATRLSMPYSLYGWDCESTLWLRWAFVKVEDKGLVEMWDVDA